MKIQNEIELLKIILSLRVDSIFNNIYREASFLKSPNSKKLSRTTLCRYLNAMENKGLIKKVDKRWLLTEKGYKTLAEMEKIDLKSIVIHK